MSSNPFEVKSFKPIGVYGNKKATKRTLGTRDKHILYERAKKCCDGCNREIDFSEMQVGHKKAYSKGSATTLANSVCLCYKCNKNQGTDSFETYKKKLAGTYGKRTKKKPTKKKPTKKKPQSIFGTTRDWKI